MKTNVENIDVKSILDEFKESLDSLKNEILNNSGKSQDKDISNIVKFLRILSATVPSDREKEFNAIIDKIDETKKISEDDLENLKSIISSIETEKIEQAEKEKIAEQWQEIKKTQGNLNKLKAGITYIEEKLKQEFSNLSEEVKDYVKDHPFLGRVLLSQLPEKIQKKFLGEDDSGNLLDKIKNAFYGALATLFAPIIMLFAPKELKDLLDKIKNFYNKIEGTSFLDKLKTKGIFSGIKEILSVDQLKLVKDKILNFLESKATEWFGITGNENKKKFKKVLEKWWKGISSSDEVKTFGKKLLDGKISLEKLNFSDLLSGLGIGVKGTIDFLSLMVKENLIGYKQIGLKIVNGMGHIVLNSALFLPHMVGILLGKYSLDDLYSFITNTKNLDDTTKTMLAVMIYRTINTPPFSLLQHIAAAPLYLASALANWGRDVTAGKVFMEVMNGGIDKQLKLLSDMEKELTGREGKIFDKINEAFNAYKEGILVSYAYSQAKDDIYKFKQILEDAGYKELASKFSELNPNKIATFIDSKAAFIKNLDETWGKGLPEDIKVFIGGIVGETNLFKEVTSKLSTALKDNSEIFKKGFIFDFIRKWEGKVNFAMDSAHIVKLKDYIHFTGDVKDLKAFTEELRQLAVHSPEIVKFLFRNSPVIFVSADIIKAIEKGDNVGKEILKTYMSFVPIVGPIMFALDNTEKGSNNIITYGTTAVWLGLDIALLVKTKPKTLAELAIMPISDTFKFLGNVVDILGRYKLVNGKLIKESVEGMSKISKFVVESYHFKKFAVAAVILGLMYYGYEKIVNNTGYKLLATLNGIANSGGLEAVNNYIMKNWNDFDDAEKKQILAATIGRYLNLTPEMLVNYISDIKLNDNKVIIDLTKQGSKSEYIKNKIKEEGPIIGDLVRKIGYEKFTVNYYS